MNGFLRAFQANLHLYEVAAGALVVAVVCFLLFLLRRFAATTYTIRNPGK